MNQGSWAVTDEATSMIANPKIANTAAKPSVIAAVARTALPRAAARPGR